MFISNLQDKTGDLMDNLKFISQHSLATPTKEGQLKQALRLFKPTENPNYAGYYNSENLEIKEQLESLQLISEYIRVNHQSLPPEVNYFLDDSPTDQPTQKIPEGKCYGTCLRDTWSKGLQFFFLDQGSVVKVTQVKNNYAYIEYDSQLGIIHINDLRVYGQVQ